MEVFNIKIGYGEREVTLTVLPAEAGYYKIIYFGAILGAVRYDADHHAWEKIPEEELEAGDLPFYVHDLTADRLDVVLDEVTVHKIGDEISAA